MEYTLKEYDDKFMNLLKRELKFEQEPTHFERYVIECLEALLNDKLRKIQIKEL